jgi:hydrogenase expression/formation protein HypC
MHKMCLAIPGKILSINRSSPGDDVFREGKVSFGGITKQVNLCMVPDAVIGDYVLVHVGVAISKIDEEEAQKTFEYLHQMGETIELTT